MTNPKMDALRAQLRRLNERIEEAVGKDCDRWVNLPDVIAAHLEGRTSRDECIIAAIAALSPARQAALRRWCAERHQVIRTLRREGARPWQATQDAESGPIAWDAPELQQAFGRLCDAVNWDGPGCGRGFWVDGQITDPWTGAWRFDQLEEETAGTLCTAFLAQVDDTQLARLEAELRDEQANVWDPPVRAGFDLLLSLMHAVQQTCADSRCPTCGVHRGYGWGADGETRWICRTCDNDAVPDHVRPLWTGPEAGDDEDPPFGQ